MKLYPFSTAKHAHDIEFFRNRLYNTMYDMENGEIPMDSKRYDAMENMYNGDSLELLEAVMNSRDGKVCYLTGKQIGLAKEIVAWASNQRAASCVAAGKFQYLKYC